MARISIVIPCYYNEANLPHTFEELISSESLFPAGTEIEYVIVDDGSRDATFAAMKLFYQSYPDRVKLIRLAGNVGSYNAILAGMKYATGDCCTVISADLQDPPSLIAQMLVKWEEGYKLVVANRVRREDNFIVAAFANFYQFLIRKLALHNIPRGGFDFALFDKKLKDIVVGMKEKNTNTLYLLSWLGYPYANIEYTRQRRKHGKSMWTLSKKIKLFVDSFVSFSYFPIRLISVLGLFLGSTAILYGLFIVVKKISGDIEVEGWSTMMIVLLVVSSFQMISLGIIGEYVWRTLDASRNRPIYVVDEVIPDDK